MFQRTLRQTTRKMGRNTLAILIAARLYYLLFTVKLIALEKVSFSEKKILKLFVKTLTVNDKHYALNRDNLAEPIQMQLSQKEKTFSQLFFEFLKSILNFKH